MHPALARYEGPVVYLHHVPATASDPGRRAFLDFERVSDRCRVLLTGIMVRQHDRGQSPLTLEVTRTLQAQNRLRLLVDNQRRADGAPGEIQDWTHDGGIRGPVSPHQLPGDFIREAALRTRIPSAASSPSRKGARIRQSSACALSTPTLRAPAAVRQAALSCAPATAPEASDLARRVQPKGPARRAFPAQGGLPRRGLGYARQAQAQGET